MRMGWAFLDVCRETKGKPYQKKERARKDTNPKGKERLTTGRHSWKKKKPVAKKKSGHKNTKDDHSTLLTSPRKQKGADLGREKPRRTQNRPKKIKDAITKVIKKSYNLPEGAAHKQRKGGGLHSTTSGKGPKNVC